MMTTRILLILCAASACALESTGGGGGYTQDKRTRHSYKLEFVAQPWPVARRLCEEDNAKLAVPKTKSEFRFLQNLVRQMPYSAVQGADSHVLVWLGIHYDGEQYQWTDVDGESIKNSDFHQWAVNNGQNSSDELEPQCAGVDALNPGLRDFWCDARLPYLCQRS